MWDRGYISDDDSNKIEKEKRSRNEDLKNFVFEVERKWSCIPIHDYPFEELDGDWSFKGMVRLRPDIIFASWACRYTFLCCRAPRY